MKHKTHKPDLGTWERDNYDYINQEHKKPMYVSWSKEEIRVFERSKQYFKIKRAIKDNERRIGWKSKYIFRSANLIGYICYLKWMDNKFRCTLKELQCALPYAKCYKKNYYRILSDIKRGFYEC